MLSIIRPPTYQANMENLQPDFYHYRKIEDQLAADLIGRSLLKLLKRTPSVVKKERMRMDSENETESTGSDGYLSAFQSDSSLSSNCSSISTSSSGSSSLMSSLSSLTDSVRERRLKRKEESKAQVVLPDDMMARVVRDVIRMAEGEKHGIRGCQLILELRDNESTFRLGKISCDPNIANTFNLRLQLTAGSPPPEAHGSHVLLNRLLGSSVQYLYIKPGYVIEKSRRNP